MDVYSEIAHFCDKLASPYIYIRFDVINDLGAGKHPGPLCFGNRGKLNFQRKTLDDVIKLVVFLLYFYENDHF